MGITADMARSAEERIAELKAEIARLRKALDIIGYDPPGYDECIDIARAALMSSKCGAENEQ